jgi:hypothetical protein
MQFRLIRCGYFSNCSLMNWVKHCSMSRVKSKVHVFTKRGT